MKLLFDGRALAHEHYTGVEIYAKNLYDMFKKMIDIEMVQPESSNRYMQHYWEHFTLPKTAQKYDILFSPANIAPVLLPRKTKLVVTVHDLAFLKYPCSVSKLFYYYYKCIIPLIMKRADHIITISHFTKNELCYHYPETCAKISVIYNGINQNFTRDASVTKEDYILYVGSLNPRKNFANLIKAHERLKSNTKLVIVGNFNDNFRLNRDDKETLARAKNNPNVVFKKHLNQNDLINLYRKARLFVYPSFYEGFGIPPVEAMGCGTPLIVSEYSAMQEVCQDAAVYADPHNIDDIAEKIEIVLKDKELQNQLIENGQKRVKEFDWEKIAKQHISVFETVLSAA